MSKAGTQVCCPGTVRVHINVTYQGCVDRDVRDVYKDVHAHSPAVITTVIFLSLR